MTTKNSSAIGLKKTEDYELKNQSKRIAVPKIQMTPDLPKMCPLVSQCRQTAVHKNIVKIIKAKSSRILDYPEIWEQVSNFPHIIEDALYVGVIGDEDLLHYLKCEIFSSWFWEEQKQKGGKNVR